MLFLQKKVKGDVLFGRPRSTGLALFLEICANPFSMPLPLFWTIARAGSAPYTNALFYLRSASYMLWQLLPFPPCPGTIFPKKFSKFPVRSRYGEQKLQPIHELWLGVKTAQAYPSNFNMDNCIHESWTINGTFHKLDGHATCDPIDTIWMQYNQMHRTDGSAQTRHLKWFVNGCDVGRARARWYGLRFLLLRKPMLKPAAIFTQTWPQ